MAKFSKLLSLILFISLSSFTYAEPAQLLKTKIGMLLPLSGQYAAVGVDNQQGIEVAKSEMPNAESIEFVFADSKAEPVQAISEFRKVIEVDQVAGVFVFRGPPGMAVNPISKSSRIPLLGGVGNKDFALNNPFAFQLWVRSDREGEFLAEQMHERKIKRVALVTAQDDWPVAVSAGFRGKADATDIAIVSDHELLPSESDLRSIAAKLKASNAEAVFLNVGLAQISPFVKQLREVGIALPVYSNFWAGKKEVVSALGAAGDGLSFAEMSTNLEHLRSELQTRFGSTPSGATLSAYAATILFYQALADLKDTPVNAETLYQSIASQKEIRTRNGIFEIKDRFIQFPMTMRSIKDGKVE